MKYKLLAYILIAILIFPSIPSYAAYDFEFDEAYCGSTGEESRKINILEYFEDMPFYDDIYQIFLEYIIVGGNNGRGVVYNYNFYTDTHGGIFQVPRNPGDDNIGEYKITGIGSEQAFSVEASEGELYFKKMVGTLNYGEGYKSFIINFDDEGPGNTDPDDEEEPEPEPEPDPEPEPEPEPPEPLKNIQVDSIAGDIIVTWDPVDGADGYKVYINGDPVNVGDTTRYVFSADPGEYEIQVTAYNSDGESEKGNPVTVVRPEDNPVIIIQPPAPPACELPPVFDVNIVGVENPISIYFPDVLEPPKAPRITPLPSPSNYIPDADDFDMTPDMPNYNPRHYNPSIDGDIFRYEPPPLDIPEPIESPGPLPSIPDPIIIPHDDPIDKDVPKQVNNPIVSEEPIDKVEPKTPEEPRQADPIEIEPPRISDPVVMDPPREMTGYEPEPAREMTGYEPEPPREMTGYNPESPYIPEPPKKMDPPR